MCGGMSAPAERTRLSRRFDRTGRLLGDEAMARLGAARGGGFGLGGVGGYAVEGLVRRGVTLGVPVVSCMGAAGRLDPTALRVGDLSETVMDPFAKDVRKHLRRKYGVGADGGPTGITAVWSVEPCAQPVALEYDQQTC